ALFFARRRLRTTLRSILRAVDLESALALGHGAQPAPLLDGARVVFGHEHEMAVELEVAVDADRIRLEAQELIRMPAKFAHGVHAAGVLARVKNLPRIVPLQARRRTALRELTPQDVLEFLGADAKPEQRIRARVMQRPDHRLPQLVQALRSATERLLHGRRV